MLKYLFCFKLIKSLTKNSFYIFQGPVVLILKDDKYSVRVIASRERGSR